MESYRAEKIFDAGENISGIVRVRTRVGYYGKITLRFAECVTDDLSLDFRSTGADYICRSGKKQIMTDVFVCDGTERVFEPKFVWHAFRYFEIDGEFESAEVLIIHSNVESAATFNSPSEGLNFLFDAFLRTQLNNMHGSILSDCPHRERLGYTGDGQVCSAATMMLWKSREFYRKWIQDIIDCQDIHSGHIQHAAPLMGGGGGPGGWGSAVIIVPYTYYKQYGDKMLIERYYGNMRRWIDYLCSRREKGLIVREEDGGWCLGDWSTLKPTEIPAPYVNSCYFIKTLQMLTEIAAETGNDSDVERYRELILHTETAIRNAYYDYDAQEYCHGIQGADAFAVWCGLAGAETAGRLASKYDALGHFDTGFLGTDILLEVLFAYDFSDTALHLLESEEMGSFLYMKRNGATTLWENWDGTTSQNHPMFGGCVRHLFSGILGIRNAQGGCGYQNVIITPCIPKKLAFAEGCLETEHGQIYVKWEKKDDDRILFTLSVPETIDAVFEYHGFVQRIVNAETSFVLPISRL